MDTLFDYCVEVLKYLALLTGTSYKEINIIVFVIIHPIITLSLLIRCIVLRKKLNKEKLKANDFSTKKGNPIRNVGLIKSLINRIETLPLIFTKIKAHQKATEKINYNRVVDKLARDQVRKNCF